MSGDRKGRDLLKPGSLLWVAVGAVAFAYLLVWLLGPGGAGSPPQVDIYEFLDPLLVERASAFRSGSRLLSIASIAIGLGALGFLSLNRGRPVRATFDWLGRRPIAGSAAAGALIVLLLALLRFPLRLVAFERGRDVGVVTQDLSGWLGDQLLGTLISVVLTAAGAALALWLWRRFGRRFWVAGSVLVASWIVIFVWLWPVVVSPLFNEFRTLPDGPARAEVTRLADRAGVEVEQVRVVDASRRSSTLNAYVNGIGSSKQVVIYDNAIDRLSESRLSALIAHELAHVAANDVYRGLAFAILVTPFGVLFVQLGTSALVRFREGDHDDGDSPIIIPALALMITLTTLVLSVPGNLLSREIEAHADREAVRLTGDPAAVVGLNLSLAKVSLADPDPPGLYQYLFGTHPTARERISAARALTPHTEDP